MTRAALLACLAAGTLAAAPVPRETDAARLRRIYGEKGDPRGDCSFELTGDRLRITVPPRPDWLILLIDPATTARVGKKVRGDFTAVVRVAFPIRGFPPDDRHLHEPIAVGGLFARAEDGESAWVMRAEQWYDGKYRETFHGAVHAAGRGSGHGVMGGPKGEPTAAFVRLRREGQTVRSAYGRDGKEWTALSEYDVGWGETVTVGVIAENGYAARFEATFDQYTLTQPKK